MAKIKSRNLLIIIAAAAIIIFAAATQITAHINLNAIEKAGASNNGFKAVIASEDLSIRLQPIGISFSAAKIKKGDEIKIIASTKNWSRVIAASGNKIKRGYIKSERLAAMQDGFIPASSISLKFDEATAVIGTPLELTAQLTPDFTNEELTWLSSNEEVATVKNGIVTPLKKGKTLITAKALHCESTIEITVLKKSDTLQFKTSSILTETDRTINLAECFTEKIGENVKYELLNPELAKIEGGKLIPLSAGKTILTASNGESSAQCAVEIREISGHSSAPLPMMNAYGNIVDYHPGVVFFEEKWNGYKYWLAHTPYTYHNDIWENPHIMASNDMINWEEPIGFKNPLEPVPENHVNYKIYNSDTELVYNSDTNTLECWWRFYNAIDLDVIIYRKTTKDGVHWSDKEQLLISPDMKFDFLSPSVLYEDGIYKMWSVNQTAGFALEYRESKDAKNWSDVRKIDFQYEDPDWRNWHLDVIHTPKGYEISMSGSDKKIRGHNNMSVYYSYSPDNVHYTVARPMLNPQVGKNAWDNQGHYRSSLVYSGGKYYLFYSGLDTVQGARGIGLIGEGTNPFNMKQFY